MLFFAFPWQASKCHIVATEVPVDEPSWERDEPYSIRKLHRGLARLPKRNRNGELPSEVLGLAHDPPSGRTGTCLDGHLRDATVP